MDFAKEPVILFFLCFSLLKLSCFLILNNSSNVSNNVAIYAVLFLSISTLVELFCVLLYAFYFPKLPIVKYFRAKAASEGSKTVTSDLAAAGVHNPVDQVVRELSILLQAKFCSRFV